MEGDTNELDNIDPDFNHFETNNVKFKAYNVDDFSKCIFKKDNLNVFHHNARSLMKDGGWITIRYYLALMATHSKS